MSFLTIFFLFLLWRIFDFLILFFAPRFIPYLGFFPYKEILVNYHLPFWAYSLANFDGVHYLLIARQGYMQYEQAFFPLYPILIKLFTPILFNNQLLAGLLISNISFLFGIWFFLKLIESRLNREKIENWLIILLLAFPTSFFFGAVYTEGLFFFLFIASLYFFQKKNYFLATIFAFFASLTRLIGILLIVPFVIYFLLERQTHPKSNLRGWISAWRKATIIAPFLGFLIYIMYLWKTTGDPLFFLTSQPIFGAHRSTNLIFLPQVYFRYLKIFFTASFNFQYFVSLFEFIVFNFVFVILILDLIPLLLSFRARLWRARNPFKKDSSTRPDVRRDLVGMTERLGLNFFSLANLLLPTLTGTFSSIPRYALLSLSFFIFLAEIKNTWLKTFIALVFLILHIIILGFFGQGYFIG